MAGRGQGPYMLSCPSASSSLREASEQLVLLHPQSHVLPADSTKRAQSS